MNVLIYIIVLIVMNSFFLLFVVVRRLVRAILVVLKYNPSSNCLYDFSLLCSVLLRNNSTEPRVAY